MQVQKYTETPNGHSIGIDLSEDHRYDRMDAQAKNYNAMHKELRHAEFFPILPDKYQTSHPTSA